jgi:hypothetical protein
LWYEDALAVEAAGIDETEGDLIVKSDNKVDQPCAGTVFDVG